MIKNYLLPLITILVLTSCGKSKKEIEQEKIQMELKEKILAENKEKERIHLEKIEVGKSIAKTFFANELERVKKVLSEQENKLEKINEFQFGRLGSTKRKQLNDQNLRIRKIRGYLSKIEKEISLTNLRETFDFQDSPEGVINYLFETAKNNDFEKLRYLCDPYGENDVDSRRMCYVAMQTSDMQKKFVENFKNGRIIGVPIIIGDKAEVEFAYGPSSNKLEKMNLINRMGKWYLGSF